MAQSQGSKSSVPNPPSTVIKQRKGAVSRLRYHRNSSGLMEYCEGQSRAFRTSNCRNDQLVCHRWMVDVTATNSVHYSLSSYCAPFHFISPPCLDHEQSPSSSSTLIMHLHTQYQETNGDVPSFLLSLAAVSYEPHCPAQWQPNRDPCMANQWTCWMN